eukprot:Skav212191  [mRNA]  locus=scaffold754:566510:567014:- [translate_table: standard]
MASLHSEFREQICNTRAEQKVLILLRPTETLGQGLSRSRGRWALQRPCCVAGSWELLGVAGSQAMELLLSMLRIDPLTRPSATTSVPLGAPESSVAVMTSTRLQGSGLPEKQMVETSAGDDL